MSLPTPSQALATSTPGNVLVMAGAGTGKTRTLVERCITWLRDPVAPGSFDRLLMVTFTDAAAAEMRRRIRQRLEAEALANPTDPRLHEQLALLDTARIQTLHSFCLELVRQHFLELGIDPQIRVLDEGQSGLLANDAFDQVLEAHLAGGTALAETIQHLIRERGRGWEIPIRDLVFKLHDYLRTRRDPDAWLLRETARFASPQPHHWLQALQDGLILWRASWQPILAAQPPEAVVPAMALQALTDLGPTPQRALAADALAAIRDADKSDWPTDRKTAFRNPVKKFFEESAFWCSLLPVKDGIDPVQQDWEWVRGQMTAVIALTREFNDAYTNARRQQGALDFADLEQLALQLLCTPAHESAPATPSPIALEWRTRLDRVFVDEYQDINETQDAILHAVGREGPDANRFLVGDVKQSIYRFRLADPRIFQRYAAQWLAPDGSGGGRVVSLADNFRSHEGILSFVNALFEELMRPELGGVAYDADAKLQFGSPDTRPGFSLATDDPTSRRVELHLRLKGGEREEADGTEPATDAVEERDDAEHEARLIGLRLLELKQCPDAILDESSGTLRAPEWNDMLVLMRAPRGRVEIYAREFARLGIPLVATRGGFLEAIEISDLVNLLRLLDNPLQDIPLLAVLRSPLVGLSLEALAEIRLAAPKERYWTALPRWLESPAAIANGATQSRVTQFLERFARWRALARQGALSECLETVLDETRYADWCLAQDRGRSRHANVMRLLSMTRQFDPLQRQGLFRFLRHLDAREDAGLETTAATVEAGNAVRLLSVHQSKGLEAPIVVVADLGRRFNFLDTAADVILDEDLGLCPRVKPPHAVQRYPGITHWLASKRQRRESLGEELRLFYVATTRAAQRLILVGTASASAPRSRWQDWLAMPVTTQRLHAANGWMDWLGPWLPTATGSPEWYDQPQGVGSLLTWTLYGHDDARLRTPTDAPSHRAAPSSPNGSADNPVRRGGIPADAAGPNTPSPSAEDLAALDALSFRLRWRYRYAAATREPAKTSVSALRPHGVSQEPAPNEEAQPAEFLPAGSFVATRTGTPFDAAQVGILHHAFLQRVSLNRVSSRGELRGEIERLKTAGVFTPEEAAALDLRALHDFWQSEVGLRIRTQAPRVQREMPFTLRLHHADLQALELTPPQDALADEQVIVQGVVDLAVIRPKEIWLLDFKTDLVRSAGLEARIRFHTPQVRLYALALERIFNRPVTRRWIHFLALRRTVEPETNS